MKNRAQDPAEQVRKALAIARLHDRISEKFERRALDLIEAERARRTPQEWLEFTNKLGLSEEEIDVLRVILRENTSEAFAA